MKAYPVVIGIDHERASVEFRERLSFTGAALADGLLTLPQYAREGLILSTCNRTEVYAIVDRGDVLSPRRFLSDVRGVSEYDLDRTAYLYEQRDAVRHIFRVASGLESIVLGEPQILGQIRDALAASREHGAAGPVVTRLATEALRVGKLVRTKTGIGRNRLSIAHAAVDLATRHIGSLEGQVVAVVGAGKMAELSAKLLRVAGVADLIIANRTEARGRALAQKVGGRFIPLASLPDVVEEADAIFSAATMPVFGITPDVLRGDMQRRSAPLVVIDLGVPRNVDPVVGEHEMVHLFDVDDLEAVMAGQRLRYEIEIGKAEALIEEAVDEFLAWSAARAKAPVVAELRQQAETIRTSELERTLRRLGHLSDRDRNLVAALSVGLVNKLLHDPITRLMQSAGDDEVEEIARFLFDLDDDNNETRSGANTTHFGEIAARRRDMVAS